MTEPSPILLFLSTIDDLSIAVKKSCDIFETIFFLSMLDPTQTIIFEFLYFFASYLPSIGYP